MKIHNIRLGLATNSSSTHSIIILPKGTKLPKDYDTKDGEFGWNNFTAASRKSKKLYLATILHGSLKSIVGDDVANAVVDSWVGIRNEEGYIDHQSRIDLPLDWEGKAVSKEFFDDFSAYLLNNRVVILGGNDNDGDEHPLYKEELESKLPLPIETGNKHMVCRKDGEHWTIFDRLDGTKIRFTFNDKAPAYTKATNPELVDIKITDYCPYNCAYCYQGSTTKGDHAALSSLMNIIRSLNDLKVFEVALGGGEPTFHPEFVSILKAFREHNIVPNFTTKSTAWLEDDAKRTLILEHAGNFAYSAEKGEDVEKVVSILNKNNVETNRLVIHYVMGVGDEKSFKDVVKACGDNHIELTLLGYKTNGRGSLFQPKDNGSWLKYLKKLNKEYKCPKIGIDTKLAQVASDDLKKAGIPHEMYHTEEGKFSMYIDAVDGLIAPSSYCNKEDMKHLVLNNYKSSEIIAKHFASF